MAAGAPPQRRQPTAPPRPPPRLAARCGALRRPRARHRRPDAGNPGPGNSSGPRPGALWRPGGRLRRTWDCARAASTRGAASLGGFASAAAATWARCACAPDAAPPPPGPLTWPSDAASFRACGVGPVPLPAVAARLGPGARACSFCLSRPPSVGFKGFSFITALITQSLPVDSLRLIRYK